MVVVFFSTMRLFFSFLVPYRVSRVGLNVKAILPDERMALDISSGRSGNVSSM